MGIRIATYGHEMEVNCVCPKCTNTDEYTTDLRGTIDLMKSPNYQVPLHNGDMEIYFRPMNYKMLNQNSQLQFEEQKVLQSLASADEATTEKQSHLISNILQKITDMTVKAIAQSIGAIKTPTSIVTESDQIEEFLKNCDRKLFSKIRDNIINLKSQSELKPMKVKCTQCSNEYEQPFTLDMSSFFDSAS